MQLVVSGGLWFPSRLLLSQNSALSIFPSEGPAQRIARPQLGLLLKVWIAEEQWLSKGKRHVHCPVVSGTV